MRYAELGFMKSSNEVVKSNFVEEFTITSWNISVPICFNLRLLILSKLFEYVGDGASSKEIVLDRIYRYIQIICMNTSPHTATTKHFSWSAIAKQGETTKMFNFSTLIACSLSNNKLTVYYSRGEINAIPAAYEINLNAKGYKYLLVCYP